MIAGSISNIGGENLTIAIVGYIIVFGALVALVFVFQNIPKLMKREAKKRMKKKGIPVPEGNIEIHVSGEENAAIAMAMYLYFNEMHDEESNIVTIKKVSKSYSPWSSKIYGLNILDRKRW